MTSDNVKSIGEVVLDFTAEVLESERRLVAAGFVDPIALHDAAHRHGLYGARFGCRMCDITYSTLCSCAECGVTPSISLCLEMAKLEHVPIVDHWFEWLLRETDFDPKRIDLYAEEVLRLAEVRERIAERRLRALGDVLIDPERFVFTVRERQREAPVIDIPERLRRKARRSNRVT